MRFNFKAAFALGWQTFRAHTGALLGAAVVFFLVHFAASSAVDFALAALISGAPDIAREPSARVISFLLLNASKDLLTTALLSLPLGAGFGLLVLRHMRGESPGLGALFADFSGRYAPLVGISALAFMPLALGAALFLKAGPSPLFLLLIPVFIWLAVRLGFAYLLCVDPRRRLGAIQSFAASWRLTGADAVFWPLLGIGLALGLFLALGIALILTPLFALDMPPLLIISLSALLFLPLLLVGLPLFMAVPAAYELIAGGAESAESAAP